jgi:hypothetical protein
MLQRWLRAGEAFKEVEMDRGVIEIRGIGFLRCLNLWESAWRGIERVKNLTGAEKCAKQR